MILISSPNSNALDIQQQLEATISLIAANTVTYNINFCNYQLTPKEYVMTNGVISIQK